MDYKEVPPSNAPCAAKDQDKGASMLEYALLASLIAVVCILAVTFLGRQTCRTFSQTGSAIAAN